MAETPISDFLVRLSEEPELLESYLTDPKATLNESGVDEPQQQIFLSDDPADLLTALKDENEGETLGVEEWRPIRFPLPIPWPRPIRRAE